MGQGTGSKGTHALSISKTGSHIQIRMEPLFFKRRYEQKVKRLRAVCISKLEFIGGGKQLCLENTISFGLRWSCAIGARKGMMIRY